MRKLLVLTAVLLTAAWPGVFAQNPSSVGTWKYNASQSDFGSGTKPKSMTLVITKDTPQMLAWHLTEVDTDGKVIHESWSGPQDGSMHPLKRTGGNREAGFQASGDQFTITEKSPDGTNTQSQVTKSDNGDTMTEHVTGTGQGGAPMTATIVWHRVTGTKKVAK
jgi:hypothetical protein